MTLAASWNRGSQDIDGFIDRGRAVGACVDGGMRMWGACTTSPASGAERRARTDGIGLDGRERRRSCGENVAGWS